MITFFQRLQVSTSRRGENRGRMRKYLLLIHHLSLSCKTCEQKDKTLPINERGSLNWEFLCSKTMLFCSFGSSYEFSSGQHKHTLHSYPQTRLPLKYNIFVVENHRPID
jgi:hypothetical protein